MMRMMKSDCLFYNTVIFFCFSIALTMCKFIIGLLLLQLLLLLLLIVVVVVVVVVRNNYIHNINWTLCSPLTMLDSGAEETDYKN